MSAKVGSKPKFWGGDKAMSRHLSITLLMALSLSCQDLQQDQKPIENSAARLKTTDAVLTGQGTKMKASLTFTHRITKDAPYYKTGPQQARPQDGILKAGTKIKLIKDAGSYSLVETEQGIEAYVAISDMEEI